MTLTSPLGPKPVVVVECVPVAGPLVAEQLPALGEQRLFAEQDRLVVVADLVPEVPEQRAVRLTEAHAERLAGRLRTSRQDRHEDVAMPSSTSQLHCQPRLPQARQRRPSTSTAPPLTSTKVCVSSWNAIGVAHASHDSDSSMTREAQRGHLMLCTPRIRWAGTCLRAHAGVRLSGSASVRSARGSRPA